MAEKNINTNEENAISLNHAFQDHDETHEHIPTGPVLYETVYKKGNMKGEMRFYHEGGLSSAVERVKNYLSKKHLKHLHTMPFVIDLDNENLEDQMRMMI